MKLNRKECIGDDYREKIVAIILFFSLFDT